MRLLRSSAGQVVIFGGLAAIAGLGLRAYYDSKRGTSNPLQQTSVTAPMEAPSHTETLDRSLQPSTRSDSIEPAKTPVAEPRQTIETKVLKDFAIYYAWPSCANGSAGDIVKASKLYSRFDCIVFGAGIEIPIDHKTEAHPDKKNTIAIIQNLKGRTTTFGYVNLGFRGLSPGRDDQSREELTNRIQAWYEMGVDGIFFDESSPNYNVDYERLDHVLQDCRKKGISVFINSDFPGWLRLSGLLKKGDYVLKEPFAFSEGKPWEAINHYKDWKDDPGIRVIGVATCDTLNTDVANQVRRDTRDAAIREKLYGYVVTAPEYGVKAPWKDTILLPK